MEKLVFMEGCYLLSLDGTGYFASSQVHCPSCLEKKSSKTGEIRYAHQLLGGAIVHPDFAEVVPFAPEAIIKQDGKTKNDCERNAAKRFLEKLRQDHPHLPLLSSKMGSVPMRRILLSFENTICISFWGSSQVTISSCLNLLPRLSKLDRPPNSNVKVRGSASFSFHQPGSLNESNPDELVNFVEYWEIKPGKTQHFSWVTDFTVTTGNVFQICVAGEHVGKWRMRPSIP